MKRLLKRLFIICSKLFFTLIYKKEYLKGKWFEQPYGWIKCWLFFVEQKIIGHNRHVPFPCSPHILVGNVKNLRFDINNIDNFWKHGNYFQCWGGEISIGSETWIAPGVGIITENHDVNNLEEHCSAKDVVIGEKCWIGMNSVILPGVVLGDRTIVGAGAVVTKSFPEGNCIIGGIPAKIIKNI